MLDKWQDGSNEVPTGIIKSQPLGRRAFLAAGAGASVATLLWWLHKPIVAASALGDTPAAAPPATIVQFSAKGERIGTVTLPFLVKPDSEWRRQLSATSFNVARRADTELPFTGDTWNEHSAGLFRCICCDTAVFHSATKFDSGTGWPSFWQPIARENVLEVMDHSWGTRTAVSCRHCAAHLGHVFDDGPPPTGLRYCMNSAAMRFVELA